MTELYIREAESIRDGFGKVFTALPGVPSFESSRIAPTRLDQRKTAGI
jgi:hypothetical protein